MLIILDNIKGKRIFCYFIVLLYIVYCILLVYICRGRYMLKRKKKIIIGNYELLCVLYNVWSVGFKKLFRFFKFVKFYIDIFYIVI